MRSTFIENHILRGTDAYLLARICGNSVATIMQTYERIDISRRTRELNLPTYAKGVMTLFCVCVIFFGLLVSSYLVLAQKGMSLQLSELQNSGVELSSSAIATIERYGHTADMGPVSLAPDLPSIVIWATIGFMFIGGIWFKYPDQK